MGIKTSCPHCDREYALSDKQAGKTVRCRACQEYFTVEVPGSRSRRRDEDERPQRRERRRDPEEDRDEGQGRSRRGGIPVWVWLLGGAALLLFVCGGGGVALWMHGKPGGRRGGARR